MVPLQGWHKRIDDKTSQVTRLRIGLFAVCACLLVSFAWLLHRPYEQPILQVVVVSPGLPSQVNAQQGAAYQSAKPRSANARSDSSQGLGMDVSQLLCNASGRCVERVFQSHLPKDSLVSHGIRIDQQAHALPGRLRKSLKPQTTLIIYLAGVLSLEQKQPSLCNSTHEAAHGGDELLLMPLIEKLQTVPCKQILLCLDLVPPRTIAPAVVAAPLIVEDFTENLERQLASFTNRTPIAVCVAFNSNEPRPESRYPATALATSLTQCFDAELKDGQFELHAFKDAVVDSLQKQSNQTYAIWLASAHWPVHSPTILVPNPRRDSLVENTDLPANSHATQADWKPTIADLADLDLEQLNRAQLLAAGRSFVESLDKNDQLVDESPTIAWLPLPAHLSYRERHPYASAWMEYQWHETETGVRLAGEDFDVSSLRALVGQLREVVGKRQLQDATSSDRPKEPADPASIEDVFAPTHSLIINALLSRFGVLREGDYNPCRVLCELATAIDNSAEADECLATLDKLIAAQPKRYIELQACSELCRARLPWPTAQSLMRLRLLALRAHTDLFSEERDTQALLREADQMLVLSHPRTDFRSDVKADDALDQIVPRACGLYRAAIERQIALLRDGVARRAAICQALVSHRWTIPEGTNRLAAYQALEHLAQACPLIFENVHADNQDRNQANDANRLEQQLRQVRECLAQPMLARERRITAILEFNRAMLADAESTLTQRNRMHSKYKDTVIVSAIENCDRSDLGGLRLFMNLVHAQSQNLAHNWISKEIVVMAQRKPQPVIERLQQFEQSIVYGPAPARCKLAAYTTTSADSISGQGRAVCVLMPNRLNAVQLQLAPSMVAPSMVESKPSRKDWAAQVWIAGREVTDIPAGAVEALQAEQWLSQQPDLKLLARATNVGLDQATSQPSSLFLSQVPEAGDLAKQPVACRGLLVGITDLSTKQLQFEWRPLHVRHPQDYLQPTIGLDFKYQNVNISNRLRPGNAESCTISTRLMEWPAGALVANSLDQLSAAGPESRTMFSVAGSRASRMALVTDVDGWPGALVSLIDRERGAVVDEPIASLSLQTTLPEMILPATQSELDLSCLIWASPALIDSQTEIRIGWDRNQDRTLDGEPSAISSQLQTIYARCHGIDATGAVMLESRVEPLNVKLSTVGVPDRRVLVVAELHRGSQKLADAGTTVVVDRQSPIVSRTRFVTSVPALQGKAVALEVDVDDHGLSGAAHVEAAWSLNGRLQWNAELKPITGILRPSGAWLVTLPTAELPTGDSKLLVRAIDKAGNISEAYPVTIHLASQAELDAQQASATCELTGTLLFSRNPQAGLTIELLKEELVKETTTVSDSDKDKKSSASDLPIVASTKSLADGTYRFTEVHSGGYVLRVRGIVRGMRYEQSRSIKVNALSATRPMEWRLDKQP